jgi:hypothetical protein
LPELIKGLIAWHVVLLLNIVEKIRSLNSKTFGFTVISFEDHRRDFTYSSCMNANSSWAYFATSGQMHHKCVEL